MDQDLSPASRTAEIVRLFGMGAGSVVEGTALELAEIAGDQMPEPYRSLLVHERDMTRTLEAAVGQELALRLLEVERHGDELHRRVLLVGRDDGAIVEFGAICIHLQRFDEAARNAVISGTSPLGAILHEHAIAHSCHPRFYLRATGRDPLREVFDLGPGTEYYGRVNEIRDAAGQMLAEVVELLPPAKDPA